MCLAVYIGSDEPLPAKLNIKKANNKKPSLGAKLADWTPPPLKGHRFVYFLGAETGASELGCSCVLSETQNWPGETPHAIQSELYSLYDVCPFEELRDYVALASNADGRSIIVCDDGGGIDQGGAVEDFEEVTIQREEIIKGGLVFDSTDGWPWLKICVVP